MTYLSFKSGSLPSRGTAILLPIAALLICWGCIILPVFEMFSNRDLTKQSILERMAADQRLVGSIPRYQTELTEIRTQEMSSSTTMTSATDAVATATLQNQFQGMLNEANGQIQSIQLLPPATMNGYKSISIQVSFSVPLTSLASLIKGVETHSPYFFIQSASFQTDSNLVASGNDTTNPDITGIWTIVAYRRLTATP